MPSIGSKNISIDEGEVLISDGVNINIPLHAVKMMLGLYKFKEIKDKEVRTFEKSDQGWIEYAEAISGIYVEKYGNKTTLENVKSLAKTLGLKQIDIKRGLSIAKGEEFSGEKWAEKQPPMLVFEVKKEIPTLKVFKNKKLVDNEVVMKFFEENPIVKKSLIGKKISFKNMLDSTPEFHSMYGHYEQLKNKFQISSFKTLLKKAKSDLLTPNDINDVYYNIAHTTNDLFNKLINEAGIVIPDNAEEEHPKAYNGMKKYTGSSYEAINGFLKGYNKYPNDSIIKACKGMDEAFRLWGFNMDKDVVLYRGQRLTKEKVDSLVDGYVLPFEGYVSFTVDVATANNFNGATTKTAYDPTSFGYDSYNTTFVTTGFDKVLCLFPGTKSSHPTEHEIIVNRGFGLKILRRLSKKGSKSIYFECEIVTDDVFQLNEETYRQPTITEDIMDFGDFVNELKETPEGQKQIDEMSKGINLEKWSNFIDFELFD